MTSAGNNSNEHPDRFRHAELLLADPTSYVFEGDVLPFADIELQVERVKDAPYVALSENTDKQEVAQAALHAKAVTWPVAQIPREVPKIEEDNYQKVSDSIEEAILASKAAQLPRIMVKTWVKATEVKPAAQVEITLSEYLGGGSLNGLVSIKEYKALVAKYLPIDTAYTALHAGESTEEASNDRTPVPPQAKPLGSVAAARYKPAPHYRSGNRTYFDATSAAANDNTLNDD